MTMNWLRENRILLLFWAVMLLLGANSVVMYRSMVQAAQVHAPMVESLTLLREIEAVRTGLVDAETGQRGFVITGDPAYLEPYYNAVTLLKRELDLLGQGTGVDARLSADMENLTPLVVVKLSELNRTIELRRSQGFAAAQEMIGSDEGKRTMDAIRALIAKMEQQVNDALIEDSERAALNLRTTLVTFVIGGVLTTLLFLVMFWVLARDVMQRKQSEMVLKDANDRLALGVAALEQRNRQVMLLSEMSGALQSCVNMEEALEVANKFCRQLFPGCNGALYVMHPSRNYLDVATAWGEPHHGESVLGPEDCWAIRRGEPYQVQTPRAELVCKHVHGDQVAAYLCLPLQAQGEILGLLYLEFPGGELHDEEYAMRTRQLALGSGKQIALALANIRLRETLRRQSVRDPLTGLFNRRYLEETLEREIARAERTKGSFCVVMIDIDHFKPFNDDYGHEAGDMVLREVGALLRSQTRRSDTACRYGGEEFTLILGDSSPEGAQQRCEYLGELVRDMNLSYREQSLGTITVSMGVAAYPLHGNEWEPLLRAADQALYLAKREGRNRVAIAATADARTGHGNANAKPGAA